MILCNTEMLPGKKIVKHLGLVQGSTVQSKHFGRDIMAGLKNLVGGELKGYTELLEDARSTAMYRMEEEAKILGANAVINVRFTTTSVTQGAAELLAYGSAVVIQDI